MTKIVSTAPNWTIIECVGQQGWIMRGMRGINVKVLYVMSHNF